MNKVILIIVVVLLGVGGFLLVTNIQDTDETTATNNGNLTNNNSSLNINTNSVNIEVNTNTVQANTNTNPNVISQVATAGKYVDYSTQTLEENKGAKRVLFFHAGWCPTCRIANTDFENNEAKIPSGVVVIKTDYDSEDELKDKYGITYQHVFVQIDENGNEITKWNGGGLNNLISKVN